jgi:hypothetical protein
MAYFWCVDLPKEKAIRQATQENTKKTRQQNTIVVTTQQKTRQDKTNDLVRL